MTPYAHVTPMTDTIDMPRVSPVDDHTREIPLPYVKPALAAPRWSFLARALTALLVIDAAGLLYVAVQS